MEGIVVYKICNSSRLNRFAIPAFGSISSLLEQGSATLGKNITSIVTEPDGCQITTDLVLNVFKDKLLMLLEVDEMWAPIENIFSSERTGTLSFGSPTEEESSSQHDFFRSHEDTATIVQDSVCLQEMQSSSTIVSVLPSCNKTSNPQLLPSQGIKVSILEQAIDSQDDRTNNIKKKPDRHTEAREEHVEDTTEHDENWNPNNTEKRPQDEVKISMSSKKHASCEMKFNSFQVNWSKLSDNILNRLQTLQNFRNSNPTQCVPRNLQLTKPEITGFVNSVVDQLRSIDTQIRADILDVVAKKILNIFPCLNFVDDDGFGSETGHVWLKHKMINRNSYLNRFKESYVPRADVMVIRRNRNVRAGTIKEYWEETNNQCTKDIMSKLLRDEPGLLTPEFLQASQSYVRYRFDEKIPLKDILGNLPILRRRIILKYHFERATGVSGDSLEQYFSAKRSKIIAFSKTSRKIGALEDSAPDYSIFGFLCNLLGDQIEKVIIPKEIGTKIDAITIDCTGPVLVAIDCGNNERMYYVYAEQVRLNEGTTDVVTAIGDLMSIHYVHNFMYMKDISKFLEFVQQYFFKILPVNGSKSNATRKGQQQRIVKRVIEAIANYSHM